MISPGTRQLQLALACAALAAASRLPAQEPALPADSLADLDIEQLARIRVSSASRRLEAAARAAAAVFVISRDDRRPELTVALVGRDLLAAPHAGFPSLPQREIQRRAELQLEWRF